MAEPERMPRYEHRGPGSSPHILPEDDEPPDEGGSGGAPSRDVVMRALSVMPFLLVAALGLIAVVSWILLIVFGIGGGDPIWTWAQGRSASEVASQVLEAVLIGLIPIAVVLLASWAAVRGFSEDSGRVFWTAAQLVWSALAVGLVAVDRSKHEWIDELGLSSLDWWFAFGVVAFAMIVSGVRLRRVRSPGAGRR